MGLIIDAPIVVCGHTYFDVENKSTLLGGAFTNMEET